MNKVYIIGGKRTPIGKSGGALKSLLPEKLAAVVLNETIRKFNLSADCIDHVIMGNAWGPGGNLARVSIVEARWPHNIPATTVDFQCGSGLSAVNMAAAQIMAGQAELVIAGGLESTSLAPAKQFNPNDPRFQGTGFYERAPFSTPEAGDPDMGEAAENLAGLMDISRAEMDSLALESHKKAFQTQNEGLLDDIIVPINCRGKIIQHDECIRPAIKPELLKRMPAAFVKGGKVTAGNACLKHDGAAVVLVASEWAVRKYNLRPEAVILNCVSSGCDPNLFPLGPVPAINTLLQKAKLKIEEIDAFEINEAFAVKILACCRQLGITYDKINILGGALAYGHPYGASGAIILLHLMKALKKVEGRLGVAAIGAAGGQGVAVLIERC